MTRPRTVAPAETGSDREEKRRLEDALEEGLEETFPGARRDIIYNNNRCLCVDRGRLCR